MGRLNIEPSTIFCHDNLEILQGINSDCIDLIYLDPPFNKKKTFTAPMGSAAEGASFDNIFREERTKYYNDIENHIHANFENKHEWVQADLNDIIKAIKSWRQKSTS